MNDIDHKVGNCIKAVLSKDGVRESARIVKSNSPSSASVGPGSDASSVQRSDLSKTDGLEHLYIGSKEQHSRLQQVEERGSHRHYGRPTSEHQSAILEHKC